MDGSISPVVVGETEAKSAYLPEHTGPRNRSTFSRLHIFRVEEAQEAADGPPGRKVEFAEVLIGRWSSPFVDDEAIDVAQELLTAELRRVAL